MTNQEINVFASIITKSGQVTIIKFKDGSVKNGFFDFDNNSLANKEENTWNFIERGNKLHIKGDDIISIETKSMV